MHDKRYRKYMEYHQNKQNKIKNYQKLSNTILMSQFATSGSYYVVLSPEFKIHLKMKIFSKQTITYRTDRKLISEPGSR
jgi:hypothetical protein